MKIAVLFISLAVAGVHPQLRAQENRQPQVQEDQEQVQEDQQVQQVQQDQQFQENKGQVSQDSRELIDKEDLPEVVLQEFNQSVYKQWTIDKVYKIEASNKVSYELHLTQPGESMVLVADAQGQLQPKIADI